MAKAENLKTLKFSRESKNTKAFYCSTVVGAIFW